MRRRREQTARDSDGAGGLDEANRIAEVAALAAAGAEFASRLPESPIHAPAREARRAGRVRRPLLRERLGQLQVLMAAANQSLEAWSVRQLAIACRVSPRVLHKCKRENKTLDPDTARRIARYTRCDLRWLVFGEGAHGLRVTVPPTMPRRHHGVAVTRGDSARIMSVLVYPKLRDLLGLDVLEVESVEAVVDAQPIARILDTECKIDALVRFEGCVATACSRVHYVAEGSAPRNAFSLSLGRRRSAQYASLLRATQDWAPWGALFPSLTIEAYVERRARHRLLSFAAIPTKALIEHVSTYLRYERGHWRTSDSDQVWVSENEAFCRSPWSALGGKVIPHAAVHGTEAPDCSKNR
jgi:hypothetical protein